MRIGDAVAWTSSDVRIVAMDLTRPDAAPYVLEQSAAAVWEEIAVSGPIGVDALAHDLAQVFGAEPGEIRPDLETLLTDLVSRNLLATGMAEGGE